MNRTTALIVAVALVGAAAGFMVSAWLRPNAANALRQVDEIGIGDALTPDLVLPDLTGRPRALTEWRGRPLLINFWATWCGPCVHEMPVLDALRNAQPPDGLEVIGIALDDPDAVRTFIADLGVAYPILLDRPGPRDSSVRFGDNRGVLPYSVLVGRDGVVLARRAGSFNRSGLDEWVRPAIDPVD